MAIPSDHLELSARLASHHRRRRPPAPRRGRRGRWGARLRGNRLGRGRALLGGVDPRWQRSTVKASYSRNGRSASWAAHGTYLAREGAQRGGGKGRGFNAEQEGNDLRIHPDYLRQGLRRRSQDLATQALGYRSEREIVQARGQSIDRLHFTEVDRALIRHGGTRGFVTVAGRLPKSPAAREFRRQ